MKGTIRFRSAGNSWIWKQRDASGTWRQRSVSIGDYTSVPEALVGFRETVAALQQRVDTASAQGHRRAWETAYLSLRRARARLADIEQAARELGALDCVESPVVPRYIENPQPRRSTFDV